MSVSPPSRPGLSRRTALRLLGASLLATVAGCRPSKHSDDATPPPPTPSTSAVPRRALAARVADDERALIAAYDAAIAAHPELAATLAPLRAEHVAHVNGLTPGSPSTPSTPATPPTSAALSGPTPGSAPAGSAPAGSASASTRTQALTTRTTLTTLTARERAAAAARVDDVMKADGSLARLLASIGGCEATHAALLTLSTAEAAA